MNRLTGASRATCLFALCTLCASAAFVVPARSQELTDAAQHARKLFAGELTARDYATAGVLLRASLAGESPLRPHDAAEELQQLSVAELRAFAAATQVPESIQVLLRAFDARARSQWQSVFEALGQLLAHERLARFAADSGSKDALRLARAGDPRGASFLQAVQRRFSNATWPLDHLGQAARLLGNYDDALRHYRRALDIEGNRAWLLNEIALVYQAKGDWSQAERHFREGSGDEQDRAGQIAARGNLALLLLHKAAMLGAHNAGQRGILRHQALGLLRAACLRDPSHTRFGYWLARLLREGV